MAWQTPKTDWSRADGVRDVDLNRIEGNILELYNNDGLRSDRTVYVNASIGDDTTGDGSSWSPYATISKALATIPRNLNGRDARISIAAGTYTEDVEIRGFDAPILLTGTAGDDVIVHSLRVDGCHCGLDNITMAATSNVFIVNCGTLVGEGNISTNGGRITVNYNSTLSLNAATCGSSGSFAIIVDRGSRFCVRELYGQGNTYGISCQGGSVVAFGDSYLEADDMLYFTAMGGRIYSGAQASIPVY